MPSKHQIPPGKTSATIVVDKALHECVKRASTDRDTFISDIYSQGAESFLNDAARPIVAEERFALRHFQGLNEEQFTALAVFAGVLRGDISSDTLEALQSALAPHLNKASRSRQS